MASREDKMWAAIFGAAAEVEGSGVAPGAIIAATLVEILKALDTLADQVARLDKDP